MADMNYHVQLAVGLGGGWSAGCKVCIVSAFATMSLCPLPGPCLSLLSAGIANMSLTPSPGAHFKSTSQLKRTSRSLPSNSSLQSQHPWFSQACSPPHSSSPRPCPGAMASCRDTTVGTWDLLLMALEGTRGQIVPMTKKGDGERRERGRHSVEGEERKGDNFLPHSTFFGRPPPRFRSCECLSLTEGTSNQACSMGHSPVCHDQVRLTQIWRPCQAEKGSHNDD